ncbi:Protein BFR2 [Pseudozyma hubeiensis]|nr:Protein BFR2 [Pseudozyma hubeiensis]
MEESSEVDQRLRISSIDLPRRSEGVATGPTDAGAAVEVVEVVVVGLAVVVEAAAAGVEPKENPPAGLDAASPEAAAGAADAVDAAGAEVVVAVVLAAGLPNENPPEAAGAAGAAAGADVEAAGAAAGLPNENPPVAAGAAAVLFSAPDEAGAAALDAAVFLPNENPPSAGFAGAAAPEAAGAALVEELPNENPPVLAGAAACVAGAEVDVEVLFAAGAAPNENPPEAGLDAPPKSEPPAAGAFAVEAAGVEEELPLSPPSLNDPKPLSPLPLAAGVEEFVAVEAGVVLAPPNEKPPAAGLAALEAVLLFPPNENPPVEAAGAAGAVDVFALSAGLLAAPPKLNPPEGAVGVDDVGVEEDAAGAPKENPPVEGAAGFAAAPPKEKPPVPVVEELVLLEPKSPPPEAGVVEGVVLAPAGEPKREPPEFDEPVCDMRQTQRSSTGLTCTNMPPKASSLASLLGTLTNAAPVDFDPESLDADQPSSSAFANGNHDSASGSSSDEDDDNEEEDEEEEPMNPRAHYADVGTSDMRKKAALSETQIAQSASQAKALKARRLEDAEKGRQVRKQIKTYERTLETRIKAQSVLRDVNRLPDPAIYNQTMSSSSTAAEPAIALLEQLLELSETLFSLRTRLNALSSGADEEDSVVPPPALRKRKRDFDVTVPQDDEEADETWAQITSHDQIDATVNDVVGYSSALEPHRRSVLDKWSLKVTSAAAAAAAASNGNRFNQLRAVNQPPSSQIDSALAGDGLSRLVSRTRVLRSETEGASKLRTAPLPSTSDEAQDDQVFDDTDFYSALLKELIERRSGVLSNEGGTTTTTAMMLSSLQGGNKKKKHNVDTKASKGRKLRYEVNEKLVNFMPPIRDRVKWGPEQIERLFRQLASTSMGAVRGVQEIDEASADEEGQAEDQEEEAQLAGLRVFG